MGIGIPTAKWIRLVSKKYNINFERTVQLGRQEIIFRDDNITNQKLGNFYKIKDIVQKNTFSEAFWKYLGATTIDSIDRSDFEDATIISDLNDPIDEKYIEKYSFVFDGGTSEHVFNFPQAIKNSMQLCEVGGYLLVALPCNNWAYHGYYQFCPDLFWEVLSPENGFEIVDFTLEESKNGIDATYRRIEYNPEYQPIEIRHMTKYPTQIFVAARKIKKCPENISLYQGYYVNTWEERSKENRNKRSVSVQSAKIKNRWVRKVIEDYANRKQIKLEYYDIDKEWESVK